MKFKVLKGPVNIFPNFYINEFLLITVIPTIPTH